MAFAHLANAPHSRMRIEEAVSAIIALESSHIALKRRLVVNRIVVRDARKEKKKFRRRHRCDLVLRFRGRNVLGAEDAHRIDREAPRGDLAASRHGEDEDCRKSATPVSRVLPFPAGAGHHRKEMPSVVAGYPSRSVSAVEEPRCRRPPKASVGRMPKSDGDAQSGPASGPQPSNHPL